MSQAKIRTLVIGGAGFIGAHLVRVLCADGRRQVVVTGRRTNTPIRLPSNARYISTDVSIDSE